MDIRSPLNQCIALSLAGILFLNPIVAAAAGLALDKAAGGNTGLGQASSQGDLKIAAQAVELNGKTYAGGSAEIRSAEELVNRQSLAAR
ncbi:hypothetical protein, partial [Pseudomonas aeruginosa]|uniref:hypothetical protein n=1 Tax=Pseudomonas aeruginosa TaxID=287 RepID=UPI0024B83C6C